MLSKFPGPPGKVSDLRVELFKFLPAKWREQQAQSLHIGFISVPQKCVSLFCPGIKSPEEGSGSVAEWLQAEHGLLPAKRGSSQLDAGGRADDGSSLISVERRDERICTG